MVLVLLVQLGKCGGSGRSCLAGSSVFVRFALLAASTRASALGCLLDAKQLEMGH